MENIVGVLVENAVVAVGHQHVDVDGDQEAGGDAGGLPRLDAGGLGAIGQRLHGFGDDGPVDGGVGAIACVRLRRVRRVRSVNSRMTAWVMGTSV